ALRDEVGEFADPFWIEDGNGGLRFGTSRGQSRTRRSTSLRSRVEDGQGHTPAALAGDDPIGPRFHRASNAILAPGREPGDFGDGIERPFAQVVDADEKLLD